MLTNNNLQQRIKTLVNNSCNTSVISIETIAGAGSSREYFRIHTPSYSLIACIGSNAEENSSFMYLTNHFLSCGLSVPKIIGIESGNLLYITEDLGSIDLLSYKKEISHNQIIEIYKQALIELIKFQTIGVKNLDFSKCFARPKFDEVYMKWDLSYFKYYYLKLTDLEFSEQKLEHDFETLVQFLQLADCSYFMYRDFQARNIMVTNNSLSFIDYQGGMQGPLHYDVVSLLYQAKAELSNNDRNLLLDFYIHEISKQIPINSELFKKEIQGFIFIRILQTLGAYGYRGLIQQKSHFISSIPQAVQNVKEHISKISKIISIPYLEQILINLPILPPKL